MCPQYEDFHRTVLMLGDIALYAERPGADFDFIDVISPSLAASLPEPPPGIFPPGYDPDSGPDYPHQGQ
ncbi:hypothetical protein [Streptomyces sp. NPDC058424]|uniref:hypothetical protein n=1 Tax=Streptomyces sp. NPDC058424 TaxID=3346491 RepID=UPI0036468F06